TRFLLSFFFSSRRRHTRFSRDWSSDVCSSDLFVPRPMLYAIFALAVLMIVHETGHFLVARAFGMRVERFSIGFGPALWRYKPKDSDTTYQVALIPFLAYVQI